MSTPLELAVDIAGTLSRVRGAGLVLDVSAAASDISRRHGDTGFSPRDIADALAEESRYTGLAVTPAGLRQI